MLSVEFECDKKFLTGRYKAHGQDYGENVILHEQATKYCAIYYLEGQKECCMQSLTQLLIQGSLRPNRILVKIESPYF